MERKGRQGWLPGSNPGISRGLAWSPLDDFVNRVSQISTRLDGITRAESAQVRIQEVTGGTIECCSRLQARLGLSDFVKSGADRRRFRVAVENKPSYKIFVRLFLFQQSERGYGSG